MPVADRMIGAMDRVFHIPDHCIDPSERLQANTGGTSACNNSVVFTAGILYAIKTVQTIRDDTTGRLKVLLRPVSDFGFLKALHFGKTHGDGMAVLVGRHGGYKRCFPRCSTTAFSTSALSTPVSVIQLDDTRQRLAVITLFHYLHQLVFHTPSSFVRNTQLAFHFQRRDPALGLSQDVHPQQPYRQRQLGILKDRTTDERSLMMAPMALIDFPRRDHTVTPVATFRAHEPFGPAPPEHGIVTLLLGAVLFQEFRNAKPLLELNLILCHDALLLFAQIQYPIPTDSIAEPQG